MGLNLFHGLCRVCRRIIRDGLGYGAVAIYGNGRNGCATAHRAQDQG